MVWWDACVPLDCREARQAALRAELERQGLDALLVQRLPNIRYLTGFTGSAALLLVRRDGAVLITDFRYATQAPDEVGPAASVEIDPVNVWERLKRVGTDKPFQRMGFEAHATSARDAQRLAELFPSRVAPAEEPVERLRVVKDSGELHAIREAATLAQEALAEVLPEVTVGQSEFTIAAGLEAALRRRGSEWHPFPTIAASGPRSALPHARTSERRVGRGEWLLLDFGAQVGGYCADLTRTVVVGSRADERQVAIYQLVRLAQQRAVRNIQAGMSGREADALARTVIAEGGYAEAFGHSLGHGLGLEVHEAPRLAQTEEALLPVNTVVTVEPGIYLPGWGGVRLEDDVHLGADGPVCLSDNRTELIELV